MNATSGSELAYEELRGRHTAETMAQIPGQVDLCRTPSGLPEKGRDIHRVRKTHPCVLS